MPPAAVLEHEHELVWASVKPAHARTVLDPHAHVQPFGIDRLRGIQEFADMPPIHGQEMERPIATISREKPAGLCQEFGELSLVHLAARHGKLAVVDGS